MILSQRARTFFDGVNVTATSYYIYDDNEASTSEIGWISARGDHVSVALRCATLNASHIDYRIEGRMQNSYTNPVEIYNATITEAKDIDTIINVTEKVSGIRLGVKVNNDASPNNVYGGILITEIK